MATTGTSKRASPTERAGPRRQRGDAVVRLVAKVRSLVAEARRVAALRGDVRSDHEEAAWDFRRRALLLKKEIRSLLGELEAARGEVDDQIKSMVSQAAAISAYANCRRVTQQYAREVRRKK